MTRVAHVITELTAGGAEEMLLKLLRAGGERARSARVVSLTGVGPVGASIRALGVRVDALGMTPGRPNPLALARLVALLRADRPDVVQTWMYHSDLLGGLAARALGIPVVWGVRHDASPLDKPLTRATRRACALLSRFVPARVVFNSEAARRSHARDGYAPERLVVVPNGFDLERFKPDAAARASVRAELGIAEGAAVVALAARWHADKDHPTFLAAAARVLAARPDARFVLCGEGVDGRNPELAALVAAAPLRAATSLLGNRPDVERVLAAADVACLSSRTESFPNVVGEAMACGVPCVATDCGDVRAIVGEVGRVVPVGDPAALADAILGLLAEPPDARAALGAAARRRIAERFGLPAIARRFDEILDGAARG